MLPVMAQFTTRVELHRATGEDYSSLHSAMEYQGFSRTIRSDDGIIYILPTAEYDRAGDNLTRTQVLNDARARGRFGSYNIFSTCHRSFR